MRIITRMAAVLGIASLFFRRASAVPDPVWFTAIQCLWFVSILVVLSWHSYRAWIITYYLATLAVPVAAFSAYLQWRLGTSVWLLPSTVRECLVLTIFVLCAMQSRSASVSPTKEPRVFDVRNKAIGSIAWIVLSLVLVAAIDNLAWSRWAAAQRAVRSDLLRPPHAVLVALFTDYQCPACRAQRAVYEPIIYRLAKEHPNIVEFREFDFPLDAACNQQVRLTLHPAACAEAAVLRATIDSTQRSALEEYLFAHQNEASVPATMAIAGRFGITARVQADYSKYMADVRRDVAFGASLGVNSTPSYFVNGVPVRGWSAEAFERFLRSQINVASGSARSKHAA